MFSSIAETSNQHEEEDISPEVNQQPSAKKSIEFNRHGAAVGPYATHFMSQVGKFVTTYMPISYRSWRDVPKNFKDDVWNQIVDKFEVPNYLRTKIELSMPVSFRKHKSTLRKSHLDKQPNLEAKKLAIPTGIKKEVWEKFCINESDDKQLEIRAKNVESRKHSMYGHTGGRKSAAMVEYEMIAKGGGRMVTRCDVWLENHTRKNRSILPSAIPYVEKVKEKIAEYKLSQESDNSNHPLSIDDDPLTQVFGKKVKGLPGVGSFISKRKYDDALHAHIMYSNEKKEKEVLGKKFGDMQTQLDFIYGYCKSQMMGKSSTPIPMAETERTHSPEIVGVSSSPLDQALPTLHVGRSSTTFLTSEETFSTPQIDRSRMINNANVPPIGKRYSATSACTEPTSTTRLCELLDWHMNCVAVAKEVTDPMHKGMCHNYLLNPEYELKVSMCVRKILDAKLYKETLDAKTIREVEVGEFFVWPKSHIKFVEPEQ